MSQKRIAVRLYRSACWLFESSPAAYRLSAWTLLRDAMKVVARYKEAA